MRSNDFLLVGFLLENIFCPQTHDQIPAAHWPSQKTAMLAWPRISPTSFFNFSLLDEYSWCQLTFKNKRSVQKIPVIKLLWQTNQRLMFILLSSLSTTKLETYTYHLVIQCEHSLQITVASGSFEEKWTLYWGENKTAWLENPPFLQAFCTLIRSKNGLKRVLCEF